MNISWMRKTVTALPLGRDLPDTDGMAMDSDIHREQATSYLIDPLKRWLAASAIRAYVSGNSFVYYDPVDPKNHVIGPDMYVVLGGEQRGQKKWVVWEEGGLTPSLAIELLSPSTEARDRGDKFLIYRDCLKTRDYFLFDSDHGRLEGFHLVNGAYVAAEFVTEGSSWIACRGLRLWLGVKDGWLRWYDPETGSLVPTDLERAEQERQRAEQERLRADQERQRADQERLRADQERQRADQAEDELRRLREELLKRQAPPAGGAEGL